MGIDKLLFLTGGFDLRHRFRDFVGVSVAKIELVSIKPVLWSGALFSGVFNGVDVELWKLVSLCGLAPLAIITPAADVEPVWTVALSCPAMLGSELERLRRAWAADKLCTLSVAFTLAFSAAFSAAILVFRNEVWILQGRPLRRFGSGFCSSGPLLCSSESNVMTGICQETK